MNGPEAAHVPGQNDGSFTLGILYVPDYLLHYKTFLILSRRVRWPKRSSKEARSTQTVWAPAVCSLSRPMTSSRDVATS